MTPEAIRAAIAASPTLTALMPDIAAIAAALTVPELQPIAVEEVFDVLFASGDYLTLKTAQMQGHPAAAMAFAVLADAKALGPGRVNLDRAATVQLLDQLEAANLLSSDGRAALVAAATQPSVVTARDVELAIKSDTGEYLL